MDSTRPPPRIEHTTPDWRHRAACRGVDPELFHLEGREDSIHGQRQIAQAKTVCRRCPVITECLEWALQVGDDHAVLGGLSAAERRVVKRGGPPPDPPRTPRAPRPAGGVKQCRLCERPLSVVEFTSHAGHGDGLANWCRGCESKARRQKRLQGPGQHRPRRKVAV